VTPAALADLVRSAATSVLRDRGLDHAAVPETVSVACPRDPRHGDYACALALRLAKPVGVAPRELAGWLADALAASTSVATVEVAGPGFLNLRLARTAQGEVLRDVLAAGDAYGGCRGDLAVRLGGHPSDWDQPVAVRDTRAGTVLTWPELVAEIGADAARFALARKPSGATLDIDLATWRRRTDENPEFYVRYAYARLSSLVRNAAEFGIAVPTRDTSEVDLGLLVHEREGELIRTIGEFGLVVETAAGLGQRRRIARYVERLAGACYRFHDSCRILPKGDDEVTDVIVARLVLCVAARQVLANGLRLLGVSAPERM
jgi:arginyl-tRNA synthetase